MGKTSIAWTDQSWNPFTGCSKCSAGCQFCYAEKLSLHRAWSKLPWTAANAPENFIFHPDRLSAPGKVKEPTRFFVNSMSDLFHPQATDAQIAEVFSVMASLPRHTFQILTKRPERASAWRGPWEQNIWMGASVENAASIQRVDSLRLGAARVKFLSIEPLLGPIGELSLAGIDWVIVGGESGDHLTAHPERVMDHAWVWPIRDACVRQRVAFFFKQSSGRRTGLGEELRHEDGTFWRWRQWPGDRVPPIQARVKTAA